ncbi:MAG: hypothetical protein ACI89J_001195 [Hyphomicrobiaceae bacterium]|jgi:hypothetical protein
MQNGKILSAALALAMVCAIPGAQQALDIGGSAMAAKGDRTNPEGRNKNRNRARASNSNRRDVGDSQARNERRTVSRDVTPRRQPRFARNQFRAREGFRRHQPRRFGRGFRNDRSCIRPRRIQNRLSRQGWDVYSFRRSGGNFNAGARNRNGQRHSLTVNGCNGRIITARNIEPRKKSKIKRTLRKIRRTFKKIF